MTLHSRHPGGASPALPEVKVGGQLWQPAASLAQHGPDARVYVLHTNPDGSAHLTFGGKRPPTGGPITIRYQTGGGAGGNAVTTTPHSPLGKEGVLLELVPGKGMLQVRHRKWRHR